MLGFLEVSGVYRAGTRECQDFAKGIRAGIFRFLTPFGMTGGRAERQVAGPELRVGMAERQVAAPERWVRGRKDGLDPRSGYHA